MNGTTVVQRDSADFLVNDESLLARLVEIHGGHGDFMGCFVRGFPEAIAEAVSELMLEVHASASSRRVGIYVCPECGDIGCGRYSVKVERHDDEVNWSDFAYENGYEDPWILEGLGPFRFESSQYELAIRQAADI